MVHDNAVWQFAFYAYDVFAIASSPCLALLPYSCWHEELVVTLVLLKSEVHITLCRGDPSKCLSGK